MKFYEINSYHRDPSLRSARPEQPTFVRASDESQAMAVVCNIMGIEEPGLVQLSLYTGAKPSNAVFLN